MAPTGVALSSNSGSSKNGSSSMDNAIDQRDPSSHKTTQDLDGDQIQGDCGNHNLAKEGKLDRRTGHENSEHSVWMLSSDSESCSDNNFIKEDCNHHEELSELATSEIQGRRKDENAGRRFTEGKSKSRKVSKEMSPKKKIKSQVCTSAKEKIINSDTNKGGLTLEGSEGFVRNGEEEILEKDALDDCIVPPVSSSRLPLVLSDKVHRLKALVECEGTSIDLSGDMGAVGRVVVSDSSSAKNELCLDLKGTLYRAVIVPSRTFCIVSFGQSEAKIESIMNDFIQLKALSKVDEAETMVEGTLDGFSFDSEDEAEKITKVASSPADQNEPVEGLNTKSKNKAEKSSGRKRVKSGGRLQAPKKTRKKVQGSKTKNAKSKK
ncbi:DNA-binding protein BIN4 isoform X2 [Cucumis melo var. makuwa]|uniref:DNA-binding protein BIN4 isoform X2 n=1 Tax=Cucumis melo var. makuwa TaxID=1194695 RepID=A0A5D3BS94_CUCMM|nr:DNA-binding protein BIN4 isoform X2 [Cucumis melo var. makuwa]